MESPDYYTVMENRIKYFSRKYDPENLFGTKEIIPEVPERKNKRKPVREKLMAGVGYIFSIIF